MLDDLDRGWSEDPVRLALVHTYRRYDIPMEHLVDFLAAMTSDLDVTGYADLDAKEAVKAVGQVDDPGRLDAVEAYERAHASRKTVLDRVERELS